MLTIAIDAGHGGEDTGATRWERGVCEADLNYDIAQMLINQLSYDRHTAFGVWMLFYNHKRFKSEKRADILNCLTIQPDICISLHSNWYDNPDAHGYEIWRAHKPNDMALAAHISSHYDSLPFHKRRFFSPDKSIGLVGLLRCPVILLEMGFISNDQDLDNLLDYSVQLGIVDAIAKGVRDYEEFEIAPYLADDNLKPGGQ